jgi:N-acetylmuramoyl-L-alanine amidase
MALRFVECQSPNYDARPEGMPVDMLVLHYTGMRTADEALARLTDPVAKVSAHYTIGRDGRVFRHVPEKRRAWHAGVAWWAGSPDVNARSIGVELVNPGHEFGYIPFTDEQIEALIALAKVIMARHPVVPRYVVGHSDVAPARKEDPGELFPWRMLSQFGIGTWPAPNQTQLDWPVEQALARFGYGVQPAVDVPLEKVIAAFQRHFRPARIDGIADDETCALLKGLLFQSGLVTG